MKTLIILLAIIILDPDFAQNCNNCESLEDFNYNIGALYE
jgi:hypothetical protein